MPTHFPIEGSRQQVQGQLGKKRVVRARRDRYSEKTVNVAVVRIGMKRESALEDYHRIAQAIAFLRQHHLSQPDLATVAAHIGLSESHCQRLFTQWAGISPKRFLQYLTVEYAKSRITQTKSLLDLTLDSGLSSPGRLHDLFVRLEAMSPGEFKANGAGLEIRYGIHTTPFGAALIATTPRGICNLQFLTPNIQSGSTQSGSIDENLAELAEPALQSAWANADIIHDPSATQCLCDRIFHSDHAEATSEAKSEKGDRQPLTLLVKGTNFQIQVWRALLQIPPGGLTTYQEIAKLIHRPTAARAVGTAVGSNPIAYLIPCHRVIRASGELGGYHWGLERKTTLLAWEANRLHNELPSH